MSKDKMTTEESYNEIAKAQAEAILELPEGHTYGSQSSAARFVEAFVDGARWQRTQLASAINTPYGGGINPQAVLGLLDSLNRVLLGWAPFNESYVVIPKIEIEIIKATIEKAKL